MSLVRRGKKGLFSLVIDDYSTGRRRRRFISLGTAVKRRAEEKRIETLSQLKGQPPPETPLLTVGEWLDTWLETRSIAGLAPATLDNYRIHIDTHIRPSLGRERLSGLRPEKIDALYSSLADNLSTAPHCHAILSAALREAVRRNLIVRNPLDRATRPKQKWREQKVLTRSQVQTFLRSLEGHRLYALFVLALSTAMRRGELIGLRWEDIDFEQGFIKVRVQRQYLPGRGVVERPTKEHRGVRPIEMTDTERGILLAQLHRLTHERAQAGPLWQEHGLVFPSTRGTPINPRNVDRFFAERLEGLGLPRVRLHDLRHTAGTHMLHDSGGNIHAVQQRLGHSDPSITLRMYGHALMGSQKAIAEQTIGSFLAQPSGGRPSVSDDSGKQGL